MENVKGFIPYGGMFISVKHIEWFEVIDRRGTEIDISQQTSWTYHECKVIVHMQSGEKFEFGFDSSMQIENFINKYMHERSDV